MTKFVDGEEITFRKHVFKIENLAEVIDNLDRIVETKFALIDESLGGVHTHGNQFAVVSGFFGPCFDIFEFADCIR